MKTFTIDQANASLPLVRAIVSDLMALSKEVTDRRQRVSYLLGNRRRDEDDPYWQELAAAESSLDDDSKRIRDYVDELRQLGVEPQSAVDGIVDFPAKLDGRNVYLSWRIGEPEVLYWRRKGEGFAVRKPLTAGAGAADDSSACNADQCD